MGCRRRDGCSERAAFNQPAIPLLIKGWKGSPTPQGEGDSRSYCREGFNHLRWACDVFDQGRDQTFVGDDSAVFCKPLRHRLFVEPQCAQADWLSGTHPFGGCTFFLYASERRGEHAEVWLSVLESGLLHNGWRYTEDKAALPHSTSGLTLRSVCLTTMISNRHDFSTSCTKMERYLTHSALLSICLT